MKNTKEADVATYLGKAFTPRFHWSVLQNFQRGSEERELNRLFLVRLALLHMSVDFRIVSLKIFYITL